MNPDNKKGDNAYQATLASRPAGRISAYNLPQDAQSVNIYVATGT